MMRHSDRNGSIARPRPHGLCSAARRGRRSLVSRQSPHAEEDGAATGTEGVWQAFR
jgi:hypothetical protein